MNTYDSCKVYSGRVFCLDALLCLAPPFGDHSKMRRTQIEQISLKSTGDGWQQALERLTLQLTIAPRMIANHQGTPLP